MHSWQTKCRSSRFPLSDPEHTAVLPRQVNVRTNKQHREGDEPDTSPAALDEPRRERNSNPNARWTMTSTIGRYLELTRQVPF